MWENFRCTIQQDYRMKGSVIEVLISCCTANVYFISTHESFKDDINMYKALLLQPLHLCIWSITQLLWNIDFTLHKEGTFFSFLW